MTPEPDFTEEETKVEKPVIDPRLLTGRNGPFPAHPVPVEKISPAIDETKLIDPKLLTGKNGPLKP